MAWHHAWCWSLGEEVCAACAYRESDSRGPLERRIDALGLRAGLLPHDLCHLRLISAATTVFKLAFLLPLLIVEISLRTLVSLVTSPFFPNRPLAIEHPQVTAQRKIPARQHAAHSRPSVARAAAAKKEPPA